MANLFLYLSDFNWHYLCFWLDLVFSITIKKWREVFNSVIWFFIQKRTREARWSTSNQQTRAGNLSNHKLCWKTFMLITITKMILFEITYFIGIYILSDTPEISRENIEAKEYTYYCNLILKEFDPIVICLGL